LTGEKGTSLGEERLVFLAQKEVGGGGP